MRAAQPSVGWANKANGFAFPWRAACRAAALNDPESVAPNGEQGHLL
jgi:hypothetical protein